MRIIEINKLYHPWIGGIETHVKDIAEGLKPIANVEVMCCNTTNQTTVETINGVPVTKWGRIARLFSLPISLSFIRHFFNLNANVLHIHLPNPLAVFAYFLARPNVPFVVTWHSDIVKQRFILFFYRPMLQWFLRKARIIITTSPNLATNSPFLNGHMNKIRIIPLGIAKSKYPSRPKTTNPKRFALFVGRLIYYKGVLTLVNALMQCDITLVMVGEGPLENLIKKKGRRLINNNRLQIMPFQSQSSLNQLFQDCQFFVLPSTHPSEAFGIVQLEAMIHSKPVISTNLPTGVPYVNQHNHSGIVVPPSDEGELAKAMQLLWDNATLRSTLGTNAYHRCMTHFTQEDMISKTKEVLFSVGKDLV